MTLQLFKNWGVEAEKSCFIAFSCSRMSDEVDGELSCFFSGIFQLWLLLKAVESKFLGAFHGFSEKMLIFVAEKSKT